MISFIQSHKTVTWWASAGITLIMVCSFFFGLAPQTNAASESFRDIYEDNVKACAKNALVQVIIQAVLSMAGTQVPTVDWSQAMKEFINDCLIVGLKQAMIEDMTGQSIDWIQTGFNGNPAFVQNIGDYFRSVADTAAGAFIQSTVPFLCTPFQADVQLALTNMYRRSQGIDYVSQVSCRLSESIENIDSFLDGDFAAGGWGGWYEFVSNPYSNPIGSYIEGSNELALRVSSATGQAGMKLQFANGFFSKDTQTCYAYPLPPNQAGPSQDPQPFTINPGETAQDAMARLGITAPGGIECDPSQTITPGDTIKSGLENIFKANLDTVVAADEINEIIDIAVWYVLNDVLTGDGGLAGYNRDDFEHGDGIIPGQGGACTAPEITEGEPGRGGQLVNEPAPFTSTASDPFREITIDVPPGQNYSRVRAEFDLTTAPQTAPANASQLNLFWFHRGPNIEQSEWGANDIAEVVLNAENGKVRFASSVNTCEMLEHSERSPFRDNLTYHVVVDYNPGAGTMSVSANGSTIVSQATTVDVLQSGDQNNRGGFFIKLGGAEDTSADEGLTDGFTWSNLTVNFTPGEATTGGGGEEDPPPPPPQEDGVARVFIDDLGTPGKNELYSESTSGVVTKISQVLGPDGDVFSFERTPDGNRVVYMADVQNDRTELFTVPSAGGTITKISTPTTVFDDGTSSDVIRFAISPDGQRVAYTADTNEWTKYELFGTAITGGTVTRLSYQMPFDYDVDDFKFSPNSQRIIYRAGRTAIGLWELYSTPSNRAGSIRISQATGTVGAFEVTCDSSTVNFLVDLVGGGPYVLYSVPITGGTITELGGGQLPGTSCS